MIRYLARRLLLAVPTFFGITFVTFLVIHLAPGSPVGGDRPMTQDDIEQVRRQFFLDLPLFFNFAVQDRRHAIRAEIQRLHDPHSRTKYEGRLRRRGTVAVPYLWRARGLPGVEGILRGICQDHTRLCTGGDLAALRDASERPQPHAAWGTAAVADLMRMREDERGQDRIRAVAELAAIVGNQSDWDDWWFDNEREYREFGPWDRAIGLLAETQYARWLRRIATWNLGTSLRDPRPVADKIAERFPVTLLLASLSLGLAYLLGVPLGVWSAARRGSRSDRTVTVLLFALYSLPSFWAASILILLFGGLRFWDVLPIYGLCPRGAEALPFTERVAACAPHLVLPVVCLTYASVAVISRFQRSAMLDVIQQDYIRTARAKGLSERTVLLKHALRNSLVPVITLLGLQIPVLLGGSVIVERIFSIPGMGHLAFESILTRDYPMVMGTTVMAALITMASVLVADILYVIVDPRIGYERT